MSGLRRKQTNNRGVRLPAARSGSPRTERHGCKNGSTVAGCGKRTLRERPACRRRRAVPKAPHSLGYGGSALMLGAQEREGTLDAPLEDLVSELSVCQGAG